MTYRLFSADDHIIEPAHVWTDRLPRALRDRGPHVIEEDGREYWVLEGTRQTTMGLNAVVGKPKSEWGTDPVRFADILPACYDPAIRAREFEADGIVASVGFPSLPGFGGRVFYQFADRELANLCVQAYNDFILDEWCAAAPDMFVPVIITQLWDPRAAAAEIDRCAARGALAVSLPENPHWLGLPSYNTDHWDPLMTAATDADLVVAMHGGAAGYMPQHTPETSFGEVIATVSPGFGSALIGDFVFGRLTRAFPTIKILLAETGVGYLPYLLERMDYVWEDHRAWAGFDELRPSEVFHRNLWVCVVNERFGLEQRHRVGVDKILWESDFPHSETRWPNSQADVAKLFAEIPDAETAMITHRNAQKLLRFEGRRSDPA